MYRSNLIVSMLTLLIFIYPQVGSAQTVSSKNPYILVDADSGAILAEQDADHRWYPASLTKLMSAYVTFRAIAANEIEEGSPVIISPSARKQPPSRMGYKQGVKLRIDNALKIIIVKSANDVSHALAEAVAGSVDDFVARMNAQAARLGMINTQFANPHGLHSTKQYSSARDMALLSAQLLREFPQYAYMFEAVAIETPVRKHYSYNLLLERFSGANGMKTGFVCASGYNMAGSAKRNGKTLIAVVMGTSSQTERAVATARLLEAGFGNGGNDLGNIFNGQVNIGNPPRNMRPVLCTEQARNNRYNPGAGQAVIKSEHLGPRRISSNILPVKSGGITGPPSAAALTSLLTVTGPVPVPSKRPDYNLEVGEIILETIGTAATGNIALPTPRPRQAVN